MLYVVYKYFIIINIRLYNKIKKNGQRQNDRPRSERERKKFR